MWSYYDPNRKAALAAAKRHRPKYNKDGTKSKVPKVVFVCANCFGDFEGSEVQVDHIVPVGATPEVPSLIVDEWGLWMWAVFCGMSNLRVLCKICHQGFTNEQRKLRKIRPKR